MNALETLKTLEANAMANEADFQRACDDWRHGRTAKIETPAYVSTQANVNGYEVSVRFVRTSMANCTRSLHTAGTMRWELNGKRASRAAVVAAVTK